MSKIQLTDGSAVPEDRSHTEIDPASGMQKGYVVLSADERAKGFVRPFRDAYRHVGRPCCGKRPFDNLTPPSPEYVDAICPLLPDHEGGCKGARWITQAEKDRLEKTGLLGGCGSITTMGRSIGETYARQPSFYSGTFCVQCRKHFPVGANGEFTWYEMDGREGPPVGT